MGILILPHKQDSTQQQPNSQQRQQAQQIMAEYFNLPDHLQRLYAGIAQHIAIVAYGDNQDQVIKNEK